MPSTNGVYTLPLGYLAVTGATIQASQHNPPLEDIAQALTGRLSRDGTAAMVGALQLQQGRSVHLALCSPRTWRRDCTRRPRELAWRSQV
jgi:hypothetical protein